MIPTVIIAVLVPVLLYKIFIPWIGKGAKGSFRFGLITISLNLILISYWFYNIYNGVNEPKTLFLIALPFLIATILELIFILTKYYNLLHKLNVYYFFITFPLWTIFLIMERNLGSDQNAVLDVFLLFFLSFFIQCILYFPSFALFKIINPNVVGVYDIKLGFLDKYLKTDPKVYKQVQNVGIQSVSPLQLLKVFVKYGLILFLFWLYIYMVAR